MTAGHGLVAAFPGGQVLAKLLAEGCTKCLRTVATKSWLAAQPLAGAAACPELVLPDESSVCQAADTSGRPTNLEWLRVLLLLGRGGEVVHGTAEPWQFMGHTLHLAWPSGYLNPPAASQQAWAVFLLKRGRENETENCCRFHGQDIYLLVS